MDPEIRIDVLSGRQVIMAPMRSGRPNATVSRAPLADAADPFQAGREFETPAERLSLRSADSLANEPGWQLRVVPNRYPAVGHLPPESAFRHVAGTEAMAALLPTLPAFGQHDVVIECPDGRSRLTELSPAEIAAVFRAWQLRLLDVKALPGITHAAIFRNEGAAAGASLSHSHSQIIATAASMPQVAERHRRAVEYRAATGRDLVQDWLAAERRAAVRIVRETSRLTWVCPFASRCAYQLRIVPAVEGMPRFEELDSALLEVLAEELWLAARVLEKCLGTFSGNLILVLPPLDQENSFRWMMDLLPRTSQAAGWEFLTDAEIVTVLPEHAAEQFRCQIPFPPRPEVAADNSSAALNSLVWRASRATG